MEKAMQKYFNKTATYHHLLSRLSRLTRVSLLLLASRPAVVYPWIAAANKK
jgi:hypothetical protein